jgi:hypothetical protein
MLTLRDDLVILRQEVDGEVLYHVQAPGTDRPYQLREVDLFILRRLGAPPDLEELLREVEARFGETITEDALRRFVAVAKAMHLVEEDGPSGGDPEPIPHDQRPRSG